MTVYTSGLLAPTKKASPKNEIPKVPTSRVSKKKVELALPPPIEAEVASVPAVKEKKPRTEKQLAADQKRREMMLAKKTAAHNETLKKLYAQNTTTEPKTIKPKRKQAVKTIVPDENAPPAWFNQWVTKVKVDENKVSEAPRPRAEVKEEAHQIASDKWQDSEVRQKVEKTVSSHQQRMYNMMFGR